MIESLPILQPNADRRARTMTRCHERLERRRRKQARLEQRNARGLGFEPVVVAGLCVLHLIAVASDIIRIRGMS
jgi:hypothetical protein